MYRDDSSICRAAVHAGQVDDSLGGVVYVGIERGQVEFKGSENNKVKSDNYNKYWERTFVVSGYVKKCPLDKFKYYTEEGTKKKEEKKEKPTSFQQLQIH